MAGVGSGRGRMPQPVLVQLLTMGRSLAVNICCSVVQEAPLTVHECRPLIVGDFGRDTLLDPGAPSKASEPFNPKMRAVMATAN